MRQYRYILFKDGKPWKGMFNEVDFINEYDHSFEALLREAEDRICSLELAREYAITKFFKIYHPVEWDPNTKGYRSLMREYIIGANENEGSVVYGIDWEELDSKERSLFNFLDSEFKELLGLLNGLQRFDQPVFGVTRGTGALSKL